jgi:hypothetical protein
VTGEPPDGRLHGDCPETASSITERYWAPEPARANRSVLERSLRSGPLEARRTAFSVALAIFWRMRGEVRQPDL